MYGYLKFFIQIWTPLLVFFGTILNFLTIMVFCRPRIRNSFLSMVMICLSVADIAVLVIPVLFTWIDETFFHYYYFDNTIWCNLHGYADLVTCFNCSWIMILISTERWFSVCEPWIKSRIFTNKNASISLFLIFSISLFIFAYFPLSLRVVLIENKNLTECEQKECKIVYKQAYNIFGLLSVMIVYFVPYCILIFLNLMIVKKLRLRPLAKRITSYSSQQSNKSPVKKTNTNQKELQELKEPLNTIELSNLTELLNPNEPLTIKKWKMSKTLRTDRNLSITLVIVALTYVVLTFPFQSLWIYEYLFSPNGELIESNSSLKLIFLNKTAIDLIQLDSNNSEQSPVISLKELLFNIKNMNYLINFGLYSALSKMFQQEFLKMLADIKTLFCFRK